MLHIEIVSLVSVGPGVASVDVSVLQNNVVTLSCAAVPVDETRNAAVNRELFIKLPAKADLVFRLSLTREGKKEEGNAYLSRDYLSSVALSVSQLKTIHLKPLSAGMRVKLDFVVPTFQEAVASDSHLDSRYETLLAAVRERSCSLAPQPVASSIIMSSSLAPQDATRHKRRVSTGNRRSRKASSADEESQLKWSGKSRCCVVKVLVSPGAPIMRGTPLFEVEIVAEGDAEKEKSAAAAAPRMLGGDGGMYTSAPILTGYAVSPSVGRKENLYGAPPTLLQSMEGSEDDGALTRPHSAKTEVVVWERDVVCKTLEVLVGPDSLVDVGDALLSVDTTLAAQQQALLSLADQVAMRLRAGNVGGSESFNNRFQKLAERLSSSISQSEYRNEVEVVRTCVELERVSRNFFELASRYAQIIISEMHLPVEQKTVRPLKMGGVLGGHKFMVRGVLFKFADGDTFSSYPDPLHIANKVQGHELKGLRAYFGWFFNRGLLGSASFPLAAVIDYKGHRITALAVLPVSGSSSLIYGSDDAGGDCNVSAADASFNEVVMRASCGLNLAKHYVINSRSKRGEIEIASCVDLEGHRGHDLRLYMLDFSRTFPPAVREADKKQAHDNMWIFYHMLRPELVRKWAKPLCADAFSNFQSPMREDESRVHNQEVRAATTWVETEGVVRVARALLNSSELAARSLTQMFHSLGVNMRYLGLVYAELVSSALFDKTRESLYTLVLCESVARVFKVWLRSELRNVKSEDESELAAACANALNRLFGSCANLSLWLQRNPTIVPSLQQYFNYDERGARAAVESFFQLRPVRVVDPTAGAVTRLTRLIVLARLDERMGLGISQRIFSELQSADAGHLKLGMRNWSNSCIFEDSDIRFGCIIKSLDIVERATSLRHYLHAQSEGLATEEPLLKAYSCLETALEGTPSDVGFLTLFGDVNKALFELFEEKDLSRSALFKERAETSYKQAAQLDDRNPRVLMRYGLFLYRVESNLAVAEDKLLAAAELFLSVGMELGQELVLALVGLLDKRKQAEQAARLREAFLPLQHALMREPSILPPEDAGAAATRESSSKLLQKMGGKVGKILRKTPLEAEAEEDRVLEGYLLKRKKGKEKLATKKRWVVLGRGGELRYYTDVKGRLLGTLQLQQSTVSLEDPVLAVELHSESGSSGETYYFTTDFEGPSIMRWHDAMRNASGRSPRFFPPPARLHKELADSSKESPRTRTSIFHKAK